MCASLGGAGSEADQADTEFLKLSMHPGAQK